MYRKGSEKDSNGSRAIPEKRFGAILIAESSGIAGESPGFPANQSVFHPVLYGEQESIVGIGSGATFALDIEADVPHFPNDWIIGYGAIKNSVIDRSVMSCHIGSPLLAPAYKSSVFASRLAKLRLKPTKHDSALVKRFVKGNSFAKLSEK